VVVKSLLDKIIDERGENINITSKLGNKIFNKVFVAYFLSLVSGSDIIVINI
jgi:hypothetical protein